MIESAETRRIHFDAAPHQRRADFDRPQDRAAMRALAAAIMSDIRAKPLYSLAWNAAFDIAYAGLYKPFGRCKDDSGFLAGLIGPDIVSPADMAALQCLYS